ncbi:hypothetical protein MCUN1_001778 [Malassezia cuniculi]|uniref:Mediator of RNA polymerase II transcription subunit 17 n=1 Tax=Malassezia cuniculi TaxID=948313 RepID=A0AAF0J5X8_9BASI|nr:hypothetical protein MCUN1_001778 [Malassezia cuniculi]
MAKRLRLSLEQVAILSQAQHAAIADASETLPPSEEHPLLAREQRLLDISADGTRIIEPKKSFEEARRERVIRMWEERGDFADVHEDMLDKKERAADDHSATSAVERLAALMHGSGNDEAAPTADAVAAPAAPAGTISERDFVQVRDEMLRHLDSALFNTELAQSILGMLIQTARGTAAPADAEAPQNDFMLDPNSLSLSALTLKESARELPPGLERRSRKLVLEQTQSMARNAADILDTGAAEIRRCLEPGRARWNALAEIQRRGWKLTPGRPLVDMERLDMSGARGNLLFGFGAPVLMGDGSVRDEGARDAWIGYGIPEAPVPLLQKTLAYWPDDAQDARIAFPDRSWTRLRAIFCEKKGGSTREWISGASASLDQSVDAQLHDAQLDAVDAELFRELAAYSGVLSSVFPRSVSESCITLPLSSTLEVRFELEKTKPQSSTSSEAGANDAKASPGGIAPDMVLTATDDDASMVSDDTKPRTESPVATLLLNLLRLRMLRSWSAQAASVVAARPGVVSSTGRTSLLSPLWDLFQYTLFLSRLRQIILDVVASHPESSVEWRPYDLVTDIDQWVAELFDTGDDALRGVECGGTVLVSSGSTVVAQFVLKAPSDMLVYFPQHTTHAGTGLRLAVELGQVGALLAAELDMHNT